jgi:hypothetical protein
MPGLLVLRDSAQSLMGSARSDPLPAFTAFRQTCRFAALSEPDLADWLFEECRVGYDLATRVEASLTTDRLTPGEVAQIGDRYVAWVAEFIRRADAVNNDRAHLARFLPSSQA